MSGVRERILSESESDGESTEDKSEEVPKKKRAIKSDIYKYYEFKEENQRYYCKHCSCSYVKCRDSSTASLRKHIKTKHDHLLQGKDLPNSMTSYLQTGIIQPVEKFTNEGLAKLVLKFIITNNQPFNVVESEEFRRSYQFCNPNAKLPCKTTVVNDIKKMYEAEQDKIKKLLQDTIGKISFILDGWTSENQYAFLGVMAEWISKDWKYNNVMIDLKLMEGSHTGANIAKCFWEIIEDFGLQKKIQSITTDNTGNMDTFFSSFENIARKNGVEFSKEYNRVRCLAHILNLCCQAAISSINSETSFASGIDISNDNDFEDSENVKSDHGVLAKLRKCVVKIRASPQRREAFRRQCDAALLDRLELVLDVKTRWNSTYDMIVRALKLQKALDCTTRADPELTAFVISEAEWNAFHYLKALLEPFKDITVFLSSEKFPTISSCAFIYSSLFDHLEKYEVDSKRGLRAIDPKTGVVYDEWIRNAANKAGEKLIKYYSSADSLAYIIGTVLDPCCKLEIFKKSMKLRAEVITSYKSKITEIWNLKYKPTVSTETRSPEHQKEMSFFEQQLAKLGQQEPHSNELDIYLKTKPVASEYVKNGSLGWWKDHESDFPNLSKMARDYLSACGTGVPVERLFSLGPDLLQNRRQAMSPETIQRCISLKCWLAFEKDNTPCENFMKAVVDKVYGDM